jgi:hypothetical protein
MGFKTGCCQSTTAEEANNNFRSFHSAKLCMTHTIKLMSSDFTIPSDTSWTKHDTRDLPPIMYLLTYLLMELSPSGGAANSAATQEFPSITAR